MVNHSQYYEYYKCLLAVKAERMECNGMNGAASGVMGGSKKVLPASRTFATYVEGSL